MRTFDRSYPIYVRDRTHTKERGAPMARPTLQETAEKSWNAFELTSIFVNAQKRKDRYDIQKVVCQNERCPIDTLKEGIKDKELQKIVVMNRTFISYVEENKKSLSYDNTTLLAIFAFGKVSTVIELLDGTDFHFYRMYVRAILENVRIKNSYYINETNQIKDMVVERFIKSTTNDNSSIGGLLTDLAGNDLKALAKDSTNIRIIYLALVSNINALTQDIIREVQAATAVY